MVGGATSGSGSAHGTTVEIRGGEITFYAGGGWVNSGGGGTAVNNTVSIYGAPNLSAAILFGGSNSSNVGVGSGNTLNLHTSGLTVQGLRGFQNYNFYLPSTMAAGQTMLTVTNGNGHILGIGTPGGPADINGATVNVGIEGGSSPLQQGNQVVLIDSTARGLTGTLANTTADGQGMQGVTLLYNFDLQILNDQLLATVASTGDIPAVQVNPRAKALSEGRVAGHAFLNQGSDLIIGPGMYSILAQSKVEGGLVPFAVGQGGSSRYDTGSHVNVDGFSMMTGLAWRQPLNDKGSNILAGAFFEAGWGNYDSHNSFSNYASVKGDGDTSYYGGGILARYGASCGGYFDASFRAGQVKTDFSSSDLRDASGRRADYDSSAAYYGAHAGLGYVWSITEKASLDLSTRYIWTHQNSDTVKVAGDPVKFDSADSQRWRTGARFAYAINEYVAPYAGAYYDYEFDGKARASTNGYGIDAPDLKGGTGVGELGLTIKPVKDSGFSMDLGVQGYVGVREGVTGSLQLKFEF